MRKEVIGVLLSLGVSYTLDWKDFIVTCEVVISLFVFFCKVFFFRRVFAPQSVELAFFSFPNHTDYH